MSKKIAIIGTGIAGLTAAYLLQREHDITVFEKNDYIGGHTHTIDVESGGKVYPVNTGFIVFNDWTYPNFIRLMNELGVESEESSMSFSVKCEKTGLEYNGTNLNSLFAQRRNLLSPIFLRMVYDILRFNREAIELVSSDGNMENQTLGEFLDQNGYSVQFKEHYIIPMGAAIWSSGESAMYDFPLGFFLRFFKNHGMLSVDDRPVWRVIKGGSRAYVEKMVSGFKNRIRLNTPITKVERHSDHVRIVTPNDTCQFDEVVFACHSDQVLELLSDPTNDEDRILSGLQYQLNEVVLHTDSSVLPHKRRAWASWNYHILKKAQNTVALTYDMNILQNFDAEDTFCVTLNNTDQIDPTKIIKTFAYEHPVYNHRAINSQKEFATISGVNRTHFCGAYWFNGFHEDGVKSGLRVAEALGVTW